MKKKSTETEGNLLLQDGVETQGIPGRSAIEQVLGGTHVCCLLRDRRAACYSSMHDARLEGKGVNGDARDP